VKGPSLFNEAPFIPETVRDEAVIVPRGETTYTIDLDDATVELLAQGICPEDLAQRCFGLLDWKREYARNCARELNEIADVGVR
jgi:hypothetical protein